MMLKENKDYIILPDPNDEKHIIIEIRSGSYIGVQFRFGAVKFKEFISDKDDEEYCSVTFERTILTNKDLILDVDDFNRFAGRILDSTIRLNDAIEYVDDDGIVIERDQVNADRITDNQEPDCK